MERQALRKFASRARAELKRGVEQARVRREASANSSTEEAACGWFLRFCALRLLECSESQHSGGRVFSRPGEGFEPGVLMKRKVARISPKTEDRYRELLIARCERLAGVFPGLFEISKEEAELFPDGILAPGAFLSQLVSAIPESEWRERDTLLGWLYQDYMARRRIEIVTINRTRIDRDELPAATQVFTPEWIVRFLIDNTIGRTWISARPESPLRERLEYLVEPVPARRRPLDPRELAILDPCLGSGNVLLYAFDVLLSIYGECGYSDEEAVEEILRSNLFGLDIDRRCHELAVFALIRKARRAGRPDASRAMLSNIQLLEDPPQGPAPIPELEALREAFPDAGELGSLLRIPPLDLDALDERLAGLRGESAEKYRALVRQARILSRRYRFVVTNPPYLNKLSGTLKRFVREEYGAFSGDLFSAFVVRCFELCEPGGMTGFLTPFVWMFIRTYEPLRRFLFDDKAMVALVQPEYSAFEEATVPVCAFAMDNAPETAPGTYFRLTDFRGNMEEQSHRVRHAIRNPDCGYRYACRAERFERIPHMPIAYWMGDALADVFLRGMPAGRLFPVKKGMDTSDNARFLRLWHEVSRERLSFGKPPEGFKWVPYDKGGTFRRWYGNLEYVLNYENGGEELRASRAALRSRHLFFRDHVTWNALTSSAAGFRLSDYRAAFDSAGSSLFPEEEDMLYMLALFNSRAAEAILEVLNPTINTGAGTVSLVPVIRSEERREEVERLARDCVSISRADWDAFEESWSFGRHPLA